MGLWDGMEWEKYMNFYIPRPQAHIDYEIKRKREEAEALRKKQAEDALEKLKNEIARLSLKESELKKRKTELVVREMMDDIEPIEWHKQYQTIDAELGAVTRWLEQKKFEYGNLLNV